MSSIAIPPVVLIVAGNDPSGGAGIAADIQTVTALGGHPAPVLAALTVQDTLNAYRVEAVSAQLVSEQMRTALAELPVRAIKLGLLASAEAGMAVAEVLAAHRGIPVVVDPVLATSGGKKLAEDALIKVYLDHLLPLATLLTPNADESRRLAPTAADAPTRAAQLLAHGARHVLLKGADENTPEVHNTLFNRDGSHTDYTWPRLPHTYHGSGCTLASAIAALLASGHPLPAAVAQAQAFTWKSLEQGWQPGHGQHLPRRLSA